MKNIQLLIFLFLNINLLLSSSSQMKTIEAFLESIPLYAKEESADFLDKKITQYLLNEKQLLTSHEINQYISDKINKQKEINECINFLQKYVQKQDISIYYRIKKDNLNFEESVSNVLNILDYYFSDGYNTLKVELDTVNKMFNRSNEENNNNKKLYDQLLLQYEIYHKQYETQYKEYVEFWQKTNEESIKLKTERRIEIIESFVDSMLMYKKETFSMTIIEVKNQNKIKECISFLNENISEKDIVLYYQGKKPNFNFHKSVNKILDVLNDYFINDNKNILKWKDAIMNQKDDVYKEDNIAILPKYEKNCKEYEANYKEYFKFWQKTNEESSKSNYKEYFEFWQNSNLESLTKKEVKEEVKEKKVNEKLNNRIMPVKTIFIVSTSVAIIPIFLHYLHERNFSNEILNNVLNQISKSKVFNFFYNKYYFGIISGIAIFSAAAIIDTKCFTKKNKIPDTN